MCAIYKAVVQKETEWKEWHGDLQKKQDFSFIVEKITWKVFYVLKSFSDFYKTSAEGSWSVAWE